MFDLALNYYLHPAPPKILVKMSGYLQTLNQEVLYNMHRYSDFYGSETKGVMLLEYLLNIAPIPEMVGEPDQFKRYEIVKAQRESLSRPIDPVQNRDQGVLGFVGQHGRDCKEYLIPVTTESFIADYPVGMDWNAWKRIRPFRLIFSSSKELTFQCYQDVLEYKKEQPALVVMSIDVEALCMMYSVYLNTLDTIPESVLPNFLHRYVILPALLEDGVNLWVRDQYIECFTRTINRQSGHADTAWVTATNGRIGSQYPQFVLDAYNLIGLGMNQSATPNVLLSSMLLLNGQSVLERYRAIKRQNILPDQRQYRWLSYLIEAKWIDLVIRTVCLNRSWSQFKRTTAYMQREIALFSESHPWTDAQDVYTRSFIANSLGDLLSLLDLTVSRAEKSAGI